MMKDNTPLDFPSFQTIHNASRRDRLPDLSTRRERLATLRRMVIENRDEFARVIDADFGGRPRQETELLEVVPLLSAVKNTSRRLKRWMRDERRHVAWPFQPGAAWVRYEPLGVVGIISPWNYPLLLALGPLVDVLAADNRALIKPSELTPQFSELLKKLIAQYFDADVVSVETGGVEVAQAFSALPFDHLIFTGSTTVGRMVMQAAAANLTPVTLELGGKSPAFVAADYPLDKAARSIVLGKFTNAGQTCIAPDYVLVPEGKAEALANELIKRIEATFTARRLKTSYSNIISAQHQSRLLEAIEEARNGGATILQPTGDYGERVTPTLIINAPEDCLLLREEIFGPLLPIVTYASQEEALAFINRHSRPLALYIFTDDKTTRKAMLDRAISGGVTLNSTLLHIAQDNLPFGGVGDSGMGAYHGRDGFRRMSHARSVFKPGFFNALEAFNLPFGKLTQLIIRVLGR